MKIRCKNCNAATEFRNQRGNRIADMQCRTCNHVGEFERMTFHWEGANVIYTNIAETMTYKLIDNKFELINKE